MRLHHGLGGFGLVVLVAAVGCSGTTENERTSAGSGGGTTSGPGSGGAGVTGSTTGQSGTSSSQGAGGLPDYGACNAAGQCTLAVPGCCGVCGSPTLDAVEPINSQFKDAYFAQTCPDPGGTPCPGCASFPNGNLFAFCDGTRCQEADVTQHALSECSQPSDCKLRWGLECCELCNGMWEPGLGGDLVAVATSKTGDLAALMCNGDVGCPECATPFPPDATATCVSGHCLVVSAVDQN